MAVEMTSKQRNHIQEIVDTLVFVDERTTVDKCKCINCDNVAVKPYVIKCGHIFCTPCIKKLMYQMCPTCGNVEIIDPKKDEGLEKRVPNLIVECPYKDHGCLQTIPLHNYEEHESKCGFSIKSLLPKVYREQRSMESMDEIEEIGSNLKKTIENFEQEPKIKNQNVILNPPTHKEDTNKAMEIDSSNHGIEPPSGFSENPKSLNPETYHTDKANEQETGDTLKTKQGHIFQQPSTASNVEERSTQSQQGENPEGRIAFDSDELDGQCTVDIWKINDFQQRWPKAKLKTKPVLFNRKNFKHNKFGLDYDVNLRMSISNISIDMHWYMCDRTYFHVRKFTLIDQSDNKSKKNISVIDTPYFSKNPAYKLKNKFYSDHILLPMSVFQKEHRTYVKQDSLVIKITLIPLSVIYKSVTCHEGTMLWRIDNYSVKKQEAIEGVKPYLISDSFYTAPKGYRVHAKLHLGGVDVSWKNHISLYITFISGEFDNTLTKKFNGAVKFVLMDQSESPHKQDVEREVLFSYDNKCRLEGRNDFVLHSEAENDKYLKNDALLLKIIVNVV